MIYVLKGMLIVIVVSVAVTALVLLACYMFREWQLDMRARRSARARLLGERPIPLEYSTKDHPAWQRRLDFPQGRALATKLREIGE